MWWPIILLVLVILFKTGSTSITQDAVATFTINKNDLGPNEFERLVINKYTGHVYLGAGQWVYKLNQNLTCVSNVSINNVDRSYNKALLIDYTNSSYSRLIACEATFGRCAVFGLQNHTDILTQQRNEITIPEDVSNVASTVAFISQGPFNTDVMYVGFSYTESMDMDTKSPLPGIASISLESDRIFQFVNNNNYASGTFMSLNKTLKNDYNITYVYGFASKGFSYFLTSQRKTIDKASPYISKLVRICHNDTNYYSYTEIPITCNSSNGTEYPLVQAGFVRKPGFDLAKDMNITDDESILFAAFAERDHPNHQTSRSALCIYPLPSIRQKFIQNIKECYSGKGKQGLEYLNSTVKSCVNVNNTLGEDFCGNEANHPIGGDLAIKAVSVLNLKNRAKAVLATTTGNFTVVFLGMENGRLLKVVMENSSHALQYEDVNIDESAAVNNIQLDPNELQLYVMTKNLVSKVRVRNCNTYKTCRECFDSKNPYCGWCLLTNRCTRRSNCQDSDPFCWITYFKSLNCLQIEGTGSDELMVAYNSKKEVSVKVSNIVEKIIPSLFVCQFSIKGGNVSVNAILLHDNRITCGSINWNFSSRQEPTVNAVLTVIWNGSRPLDNPNNVHVNIYNCHNLAGNCDRCLNLNEKYECGWCQNSNRCEIFENCNNGLASWLNRNQTCPIPKIHTFHPKSGPWEGGTNITINGTNLGQTSTDIKDISVSVAGITCIPYEYNPPTQIMCQVNGLEAVESKQGHIIVQIKDIQGKSEDLYGFVDPVIRNIDPLYGSRSGNTTLHITGYHMNAGSRIEAFIDELPCYIISKKLEGVHCITSPSDRMRNGKLTMKFDKGTRDFQSGYFEYVEDLTVYIVDLAIALTFVLIILIIFMVAYRRKSTKNTRSRKRIRKQMDVLELRVAEECKEAFIELQTEITDMTGHLTRDGIPFLDYRTYTMMNLFPNGEHNGEIQFKCQEFLEKEKKIILIRQLILNKIFLLQFIHTLESDVNFSLSDRVRVACLVMIVLQSNMQYCTDILKNLLAELIKQNMEGKSHPQLLLRRTDGVAEKMISSWFTFLLYKFLRECAGEPLYLLFRAMNQQVYKGPVDCITGEARYSLNDSMLIRQAIDFRQMTVHVCIDGYGHDTIEVKVLDCDTISQVKEKSLNTIYRATSYSQRPGIDDFDIGWQPRNIDEQKIMLCDFDITNKVNRGWIQVNTLNHYGVPDGAHLTLTFKQNQSTIEPNIMRCSNNYQNDFDNKWHLVKHHDNNNKKKEENSYTLVSEIYLTRLLATKGTLQTFVDYLFETIFSTEHRGSLAIKYIFDFLDDQAIKHGITDPEVVHTWKSNTLLLRFWVNLIKNPNFVFDIHKSNIIDSCLSVVAQTLMDSCSTSDHTLGKGSPSSKLLYAKDIPAYKEKVRQYYLKIKTMPAISDQEIQMMLAEESHNYDSDVSTNWALYELYTYAVKYNKELMKALEKDSQNQSISLKLKELFTE